MKMVNKLWGSEEWIYNGPSGYCMKILTMNPGFQSSLHYHPIKHETMLVIQGCCDLEIEGKTERLVRGQGYTITPGAPHRFRAVNGTCVMVECSSHHEDSDVVRIEESREI